MRIGQRTEPDNFFALILTPDLSPSQEQTLLRGEAVLLRERLACEQIHQRHIGDSESAVISNILTEREFAFHLEFVHRRVVPILLCNALGPALKLLQILFRPPVVQISFGIELPPSSSKPCVSRGLSLRRSRRDYGHVHIVVVERRLQNTGREIDVVFCGS